MVNDNVSRRTMNSFMCFFFCNMSNCLIRILILNPLCPALFVGGGGHTVKTTSHLKAKKC